MVGRDRIKVADGPGPRRRHYLTVSGAVTHAQCDNVPRYSAPRDEIGAWLSESHIPVRPPISPSRSAQPSVLLTPAPCSLPPCPSPARDGICCQHHHPNTLSVRHM